jgi:hypothetical protein
MVDFYERIPDQHEALQLALDSRQISIWTAQPGVITKVSDLSGKLTVDVQPAVQGKSRTPNGVTTLGNLPIIPDVPVVFPKGGGYAMTFPLAIGDEVLLVHATRNIDGWWQSGGIQPPLDSRLHDLTDAFAIPGPYSQATKIGSVSTSTAQFRTADGTQHVEINAAAKQITLVSNGIAVTLDSSANNVTVSGAQNVSVTASSGITLTAPTVTVNGNLGVSGTIVAGVGGADQVSLQTHRHGIGTAAAGTVIPTAGT